MSTTKDSIEIESIIMKYPELRKMIELKEIFWTNSNLMKFEEIKNNLPLGMKDIQDASERLLRFAPYIQSVFPETLKDKGIIESPLIEISNMKSAMEEYYQVKIDGNVLMKCDNELKIAGSIKARGGIYEVLKHAEELAITHGLITYEDDYSIFEKKEMKQFFSKYSVAVGSTGNLGLSIGIMSAKLGFNVTVHMSSDAKLWKKELLRSQKVNVVEYKSDYSKAVEEGRKLSDMDPNSYFVDDENSTNLFLGYAVAAERLDKQLKEMGINIDSDNQLMVYLPCGVGGGPGGVAFGLKFIYGDNVHFFFAEPTHSPCMTLGLLTNTHDKYCVQDFGIDNITAADGLAVGRASGFVGKTLEKLVSGSYTIEDGKLYKLLTMLADAEDVFLEPSALAGLSGIPMLYLSMEGKEYLEKNKLKQLGKNVYHLAWSTGGSMVPKEEMDEYYKLGEDIR